MKEHDARMEQLEDISEIVYGLRRAASRLEKLFLNRATGAEMGRELDEARAERDAAVADCERAIAERDRVFAAMSGTGGKETSDVQHS